MGFFWCHEIRVEDRLAAPLDSVYPVCIGGDHPCPPEDCGGPADYRERQDDLVGWDAWEDLAEMTDVLAAVARDRTTAAPELLFLEAKWVSLASYGITTDLLKDVLPIADTTNPTAVRRGLYRVADRLEAALGEERVSLIDGCPADWRELSDPEGPIVLGVDGGYVRSWDDKTTSFEVIAGKVVPEERADRFFGFVQTHDKKPRRRLHEVLRGKGFQMNQDFTFLTDGGDTVRTLVTELPPCAEHILDWFHVTMRLTVLGQFAKGLAHHDETKAAAITERLEGIKWRLWHGDGPEARRRIEGLADDLRGLTVPYDGLRKFTRLTAEFATYIANGLHPELWGAVALWRAHLHGLQGTQRSRPHPW